jgi:hypothetical protein
VKPEEKEHNCAGCQVHRKPEEQPFRYAWIVAAGVVLVGLLLLLLIRG